MQIEKFSIISDPDVIAGIDVLETKSRNLSDLIEAIIDLVKAAEDDPDFIHAAVHKSLPFYLQPLFYVPGQVGWTSRYVAIYSQWKANGHRRSFAGTERGLEILKRIAEFSSDAQIMTEQPEANFYMPTLLDATGELCPNAEPCAEGLNVAPILYRDNRLAPFINIFRVMPGLQQTLLDETYKIMPVARRHPGYLRTALHGSADTLKVANYGQYRAAKQIRRMYFYPETLWRFFNISLKQILPPWKLLGIPFCLGGKCIGEPPKLRVYTIEYMAKGNRTGDL